MKPIYALLLAALFTVGCASKNDNKIPACNEGQLKAANNYMDSLDIQKVSLAKKEAAKTEKVMDIDKFDQWLGRCEQLKADNPDNKSCTAVDTKTKRKYLVPFDELHKYCTRLNNEEAKIRENLTKRAQNNQEEAEEDEVELASPTSFIQIIEEG